MPHVAYSCPPEYIGIHISCKPPSFQISTAQALEATRRHHGHQHHCFQLLCLIVQLLTRPPASARQLHMPPLPAQSPQQSLQRAHEIFQQIELYLAREQSMLLTFERMSHALKRIIDVHEGSQIGQEQSTQCAGVCKRRCGPTNCIQGNGNQSNSAAGASETPAMFFASA